MPIEVEARAKITNLDNARAKILSLGGVVLKKNCIQQDRVYAFPDDWPVQDGGIVARIRSEDAHTMLEFKEINHSGHGFEVVCDTDVSTAERLLQRLRMPELLFLEKRRETYTLKDSTICLDTVKGLGHFIEVERMVESTANSAATLQACETLLLRIDPSAELTREKYGEMLLRKNANQNPA